MMDMYANGGFFDRAATIFSEMQQPDAVQYGIMIKAYGNCNLANISEQILFSMLNDDRIEPTVAAFNTLMNAWAISTVPDAIDRTYNVIRIMLDHPKCIQVGLQPDTVSYTTILKCLASSKTPDSARRAEEIITEMERCYEDGNQQLKPNATSYISAMKVCFNVHDFTRAESILYRMEKQSDIVLTTRIYNDIIHQYTVIGTTESALQAEKILFHMAQLSKEAKPSLKPSERLFAKVLETWQKSGSIETLERMWKLCEYLVLNEYEISGRSYNTLIPFFAKSSNASYIEKADHLLQIMESNYKQHRDSTKQPDYRHYVPLLTGYLSVQDVANATQILIRQAESCIDELDPTKKGSISPIQPSYLYITRAWIQAGQPEQAALIMDKMQELYNSNHLSNAPCARTYRTLIDAFAASNHPKKAYYIKKYQALCKGSLRNKKSSAVLQNESVVGD
jgi:Pentatricopeptide repeat domain